MYNKTKINDQRRIVSAAQDLPENAEKVSQKRGNVGSVKAKETKELVADFSSQFAVIKC